MQFDAKLALYVTAVMNVMIFVAKDEFNPSKVFSVYNTSLQSMLLSMFSHGDSSHLATNMFCLWTYARFVFVDTTSTVWKSLPAFLLLYFGSGFGTYLGVIAVGWVHNQAWNTKILEGRAAYSCTRWLCKEIGFDLISRPFVDTFTYLWNADEAAGLELYKVLPRIGSSGAVFGVMAAMLFTNLVRSPWHSKVGNGRAGMMLCHIAYEFQLAFQKPSIFQIDNIDHVGHVGGFVSGLIIAAVVQHFAVRWGRSGGYRGRGRRLND